MINEINTEISLCQVKDFYYLPLPRILNWRSWSPPVRTHHRRRRARTWTADTSSSGAAAGRSASPLPSASRAHTLMILPLLGPCPGSGQSWWTHPWASVIVDDLRIRGNGRPCCWRGAAWAWPRRRAGTWPRVSSSVLQGGEVEEVAGLRDRAAAGTCSRRIQITKVLFTHGHDQRCFQSLPSNCHE